MQPDDHGIHGRYFIDPVYEELSEADALAFDKRFPAKERYIPIPISILLDRLEPKAKKSLEEMGLHNLELMKTKSEREISALDGIDKTALEAIRAVMMEHNYRWGESND